MEGSHAAVEIDFAVEISKHDGWLVKTLVLA